MSRKKYRNLAEVLALVGLSQRIAAEKFGVRRQSVQKWIMRGKIPYARAVQLESLTGGLVRIEDIMEPCKTFFSGIMLGYFQLSYHA